MDGQHAIVFNIQKFSLNDGPGIRTVVFLKGCPLRCAWCANPESQLTRPQLEWDAGKCRRCGTCARLCGDGAITFDGERVSLDPRRAGEHPECAKACPGKALELVGRERDVDDVVRVCLQDLPFYEQSGGGVTLSGGEALLWPEFSVNLLKALHEHGVHTAIETTGYAPPETFTRVAKHLDYLLFDVKHWDDGRHREGTGVSNRSILANLAHAVAAGKEVLPRIPVIPGFNFDAEHPMRAAEGFARVLHEAGLPRCQLLPFHQFGENKYELLQRDYGLAGVKALHPEDLNDLRTGLAARGVDAFL